MREEKRSWHRANFPTVMRLRLNEEYREGQSEADPGSSLKSPSCHQSFAPDEEDFHGKKGLIFKQTFRVACERTNMVSKTGVGGHFLRHTCKEIRINEGWVTYPQQEC